MPLQEVEKTLFTLFILYVMPLHHYIVHGARNNRHRIIFTLLNAVAGRAVCSSLRKATDSCQIEVEKHNKSRCHTNQDMRGHWIVWWEVWITRYGLHRLLDLNLNGRRQEIWVLASTLHHHREDIKWENICWRNAFQSSSRVLESFCQCTLKQFWWPNA